MMFPHDARSRAVAYSALVLGRVAQTVAFAGVLALALTVLLAGAVHASDLPQGAPAAAHATAPASEPLPCT